jgi:hypothetical protein
VKVQESLKCIKKNLKYINKIDIGKDEVKVESSKTFSLWSAAVLPTYSITSKVAFYKRLLCLSKTSGTETFLKRICSQPLMIYYRVHGSLQPSHWFQY